MISLSLDPDIDRNVGRKQMTAFLSQDEGRTWRGGLLLDERDRVAYPDGQQLSDNSVVVVYDRDRLGWKEILFAKFTEADVLAGKDVSGMVSLRNVITSNNMLKGIHLNSGRGFAIRNGPLCAGDDYNLFQLPFAPRAR